MSEIRIFGRRRASTKDRVEMLKIKGGLLICPTEQQAKEVQSVYGGEFYKSDCANGREPDAIYIDDRIVAWKKREPCWIYGVLFEPILPENQNSREEKEGEE